jgi:formylglycine-generating enzyme required for sulfatase activity
MLGNVWEWCDDKYKDKLGYRDENLKVVVDEKDAMVRVVRG